MRAMSFRNCVVAMAMAVAFGGCGGGDDDDDDVDASGDAALVGLTASVGVLDPAFDPDVTEYDLDLVLAEDALAFMPTADGGVITVDDDRVDSGDSSASLAVEPGSRDVAIVVSGGGGATTTYTIHVHRGVDALADLVPSPGALSEAFDPANTAYAVGLARSSATVSLAPTLLIPSRATVLVDGETVASGTASQAIDLLEGDNAVAVQVVSQTRPAQSYTVAVGRGADALAALALSYAGGAITNALAPAFDPDTSTYAVSVGLWLSAIQVTATPLGSGGTISIFGGATAPAVESNAVPLNLGLTSIPIVLDSSDGGLQTYTLNVTRAATALEQAYAKASNTEAGDNFGQAVALWGDTLAVGAFHEASAATGIDGDESDNSAVESGAVYVFARVGESWAQQAYIKPANTGAGDNFGSQLALWGDTLAVVARREDGSATGINGSVDDDASNSGAVYVFTRDGTAWSQQAYIKASNSEVDDNFATSIALWGDTLAVGCDGEDSSSPGIDGDQDDNSMSSAGAAYVFVRSGTSWSQQAYIKPSHPGVEHYFGRSVALWGDTLAVGAVGEDSASAGIDGDPANDDAPNAGSVTVFTRTGSTWSQQAYLKASHPDIDDTFGRAVALWGDTLAVSADNEDSGVAGDPTDNSMLNTGAIYIFTRAGGVWSQQAYLKASFLDEEDSLGRGLSLWGDTLVSGSTTDDSATTGINGDPTNDDALSSGAAHLFRRSGTTWSAEAYLKASNTGAFDFNARSVALWGDTIVLTAPNEDGAAVGINGVQDEGASDSGAAYVFR
jgi:hypothetical protein